MCLAQDPDVMIRPKVKTFYKSGTKPVLRVYYELDHRTYLDLGADINTCVVWFTHQFDKVAEVYDQSNIELEISQLFIWDTPDIYTGLNVTARLDAFASRCMNEFAGDAAQLISTAPVGGGYAHIDQLCQAYDPISHEGPYSIIASMNPSTDLTTHIFWNVFGMAHELGHTIGSPHTHACLWGPSGNQPLDNCFILEGGCPPTEETFVGTIMSYCHLNIGTSLATGFGPEVSQLLYSNLVSNPCIMGDCPKDKMVSSITSPNTSDRALRTITSSAQVAAGMTHTFSANESINLSPNFEVASGSTFEVVLDGCVEE